jgi:hypothetical protein
MLDNDTTTKTRAGSESRSPEREGSPLASADTRFLPPPPTQKVFLSGEALINCSTFVRDLVSFALIFVFYALCWTVGSAAFMVDNSFHTRLFERFIRCIECFDQGQMMGLKGRFQ